MVNLSGTSAITAYPSGIGTLKRLGTGLCIILFPMMLLFGFLSQLNILSFEVAKDVGELDGGVARQPRVSRRPSGGALCRAADHRCRVAVHVAAARARCLVWVCRRCFLGVFGAFMLAVDKGALTLVLTAFQTVPDGQFDGIVPALQTLLDRAGWLWVTWTFVTLPLGVVLQMIGLLKEQIIPRWQGISIIAGLILLINPDIEIISSVGALLMCAGLVPIGTREIRGRPAAAAVTSTSVSTLIVPGRPAGGDRLDHAG